MIKLSVLISLVATASARYNILSLDGAKYKGYMTASFVEYMEENAYNSAVRDYCLPPRASERIAMHEIFDMVTGSETGAIIASTLVLPNTDKTSPQKNMYFATKAREWFEENTQTLYHNQVLSQWYNIPVAIFIAGLLAWVVYQLVETAYLNKEFDKDSDDCQFLLKMEKKKAKGQKSADKEFKAKMEEVTNVLGERSVVEHGPIIDIFKMIKKETSEKSMDEGNAEQDYKKVERLIEIEKCLEELKETMTKQRGYKNYAALFVYTLMYCFWRFGIIPLIYYLFSGLKESTELRDSLSFIPADASVQDIVTNDIMITAWDVNNRTPRFFSKWYQKNEQKPTFNHNMPLLDMVWASASTQYYFKPAVVDGAVYISGTNIAKSPAMFAYLYATEKIGVKEEDVRMVSIGSTIEEPDIISAQTGLIEWVSRLSSLASSVKVHTMDYMLDYLLRNNNHKLHRFAIRESREWEEEFFKVEHRMPILKRKTEQMIFENRERLDFLINELVMDRFGGQNSCYTNSCGKTVGPEASCKTTTDCDFGRTCKIAQDKSSQCVSTVEESEAWCRASFIH